MHDDQVEITTSQVAALVAEQIPALAGRNVVRVESAGTVNAIFRISADVAARFPLRSADPTRLRARLRSEAAAATEFHLACPFPAPEPIHVGAPLDRTDLAARFHSGAHLRRNVGRSRR